MNHETLQTKRDFEFTEKFCLNTHHLMIVADESNTYKNPTTTRTKTLLKF